MIVGHLRARTIIIVFTLCTSSVKLVPCQNHVFCPFQFLKKKQKKRYYNHVLEVEMLVNLGRKLFKKEHISERTCWLSVQFKNLSQETFDSQIRKNVNTNACMNRLVLLISIPTPSKGWELGKTHQAAPQVWNKG